MKRVMAVVVLLTTVTGVAINWSLRDQLHQSQSQTEEALKAVDSYEHSFSQLKLAFESMEESNTKNENMARRCFAMMRGEGK